MIPRWVSESSDPSGPGYSMLNMWRWRIHKTTPLRCPVTVKCMAQSLFNLASTTKALRSWHNCLDRLAHKLHASANVRWEMLWVWSTTRGGPWLIFTEVHIRKHGFRELHIAADMRGSAARRGYRHGRKLNLVPFKYLIAHRHPNTTSRMDSVELLWEISAWPNKTSINTWLEYDTANSVDQLTMSTSILCNHLTYSRLKRLWVSVPQQPAPEYEHAGTRIYLAKLYFLIYTIEVLPAIPHVKRPRHPAGGASKRRCNQVGFGLISRECPIFDATCLEGTKV